MGSVAILTTSGDNDPEFEPVQPYRHYLYCDGAGGGVLRGPSGWSGAGVGAMPVTGALACRAALPAPPRRESLGLRCRN